MKRNFFLFLLLVSPLINEVEAQSEFKPASNPALGGDACVFNPPMTAEDSNLLSNAQDLIRSLREDPNCRIPPDEDLRTLDEALNNFRTMAGVSDNVGYPGRVSPPSCYSYERVIDVEYQHFIRSYPMQTEYFSGCYKGTREEATSCAMERVGQQKEMFKHECQKLEGVRNYNATFSAVANGYERTMNIFQNMISNPDCANQSDITRTNILNMGLNLAGRAASFVPIGTVGTLAAGATQLAQTAIQSLVKKNMQSDDPAVHAQIMENFKNLACTYQTLEKRERKCHQLNAQDALRDQLAEDQYQKDIAFCQENSSAVPLNLGGSFLADFESITERLKPPVVTPPASEVAGANQGGTPVVAPPPTPPMTDQQFDGELFRFLSNLAETDYPDSNEKYLGIGLNSSRKVLEKYNNLLSNDAAVDSEISLEPASTLALRRKRFRDEVRIKKAQVEQVLNVLTKMDNFLKKPENSSSMKGAFLEFSATDINGSPVNFETAFTNIINERARLDGSFAQQLSARSASAHLLSGAQNRISAYEGLRRTANSTDAHALTFENLMNQIQDDVRLSTEKYLDMIQRQLAQNEARASSMTQDATKLDVFNKRIYPALLACNNLRSAMIQVKRNSPGKFDATNQHEYCSNFNCPGGIQTFPDFLTAKQSPINPTQCDQGDCRTEYSRYVCQIGDNLNTVINNIKDNFMKTGQVCGRNLSQMSNPGRR